VRTPSEPGRPTGLPHAHARALERASKAGLSPSKVLAAATWAAGRCDRDTAVRLAEVAAMVGQPWSDESNGDHLYAIIRGGRVVTILWRRSTQPASPEAFRVQRVMSFNGSLEGGH
jgi:hypothetical protein